MQIYFRDQVARSTDGQLVVHIVLGPEIEGAIGILQQPLENLNRLDLRKLVGRFQRIADRDPSKGQTPTAKANSRATATILPTAPSRNAPPNPAISAAVRQSRTPGTESSRRCGISGDRVDGRDLIVVIFQ